MSCATLLLRRMGLSVRMLIVVMACLVVDEMGRTE